MKLNSKKKITLCQKALSAKELEHYAKLCVIYNRLAKTQSSSVSPIRIEQRYSNALTNATKGFLDFLDDPECIFTEEESNLLRDYSLHAGKLQEFREASNLLKNVLPTPKSEIDYDALDKYFDYMQETSTSTQNFDDDIAKHSKTFLGHEFFAKTQKAIRAIEKVDKTHVPSTVTKISPELYGAEITGCRTTLRNLAKNAKNIFTEKEAEQYGKEYSTKQIISEAAYMAANKTADVAYDIADSTRTVLYDYRKQIAAAALTGLLVTGTYSGITFAYDQVLQSGQSVSTNEENGYKQPFSDNLTQEILQLNEDVKEISSYNITNLTQEQAEKISTVRDRVDLVISDYMSEIGQKYCEQLGYQFVDATNWYDKNSSEMPYYLTLNYINDDGEEKSINLHNFDFDINKTCEWEKILDASPTIDDLVKITNGMNNLAGKNVKYSKVLGLHTVATEKEKTQNKDSKTVVSENYR